MSGRVQVMELDSTWLASFALKGNHELELVCFINVYCCSISKLRSLETKRIS